MATTHPKTIVMLKHESAPFNDRAGDELTRLGYQIEWRTPFADGRPLGLPDEAVAGTIIYGGPYCVADAPDLPFLADEMRWIEACMATDMPVIGFCQGAQMIAAIAGAWVGLGDHDQHEFGYYPIYPTAQAGNFLTAPLHVTQAHFHTFGIPSGATHLARSDLYENQAFLLGNRIYGFQFHAEITIQGFQRWQDEFWGDDFYGQPGAQDRATQDRLAIEHDAAQDAWFRAFIRSQFTDLSELT